MNKGFALLILLIIILVTGLTVTGFFALKNKGFTPKADLSPTPTLVITQTISNPPILSPTITPSPTQENSFPIVYEAAGSFSASEKNQIQEKVINPFVDYYKDLDQEIASITISKSTTAGYPYALSGIFKSGVNNSFLIKASGGIVDWWYPECMGECPFSEEFKTKYSEIISKY